MREKTTWRKELIAELERNHETWADVVAHTMDDDDLDYQFYDGFGGSEGSPFTLWTPNRVYFPVVYDGAEWVGSVPRNPCDEATKHQGGG